MNTIEEKLAGIQRKHETYRLCPVGNYEERACSWFEYLKRKHGPETQWR